ncbi:MAG: cyclic nucleotide-binding/CBS domain-containing protein [Ramlibacter sp.]|nr:cyclic nucleotide-binding/CBS domain-containing protein [Ramlibacter sp.]
MAGHPVLGQLDDDARNSLASEARQHALASHEPLARAGQLAAHTHWLLSGRVTLRDPDLGLSVTLGAGSLFGFGATPLPQLATWEAVTLSECNVALLPPEAVQAMCQRHRALTYFFPSLPAAPQVASPHPGQGMLGMPLRQWVRREPVSVPPGVSIREASERMRDEQVSSLLLLDGERLVGLVTDRDLRNRVVAKGLEIDRPVSEIATPSPRVATADSLAFDALLLMARHNIHHVPLMDGGRVVGMITATDLTQQYSTSAVHLAREIDRQISVEDLARVSARIQHLQRDLAAADASAYNTGHIVTSMTDSFTVRLIELAQAALGPAPIGYAWVAAGSQARNEQAARTDQDNCLVLDDTYDEARHGAYFRAFSRWVCDGLAACGYIHCPGDMMAMTDTWRQPQRRWVQYFRQWIDEPDPKALMLTCVFFDLRLIQGRADLLEGLRNDVLARTRGNSLFLAHMVGNALKHRPPLGLFGGFNLTRHGDGPGVIDLKHGGVVPIVDLARVYALAGGLSAVNTHDRLEHAARAGEISAAGARDLREALEFLFKMRISHQARQTAAGLKPDNFLALEELSNFERTHLKNAFTVVQTLQEVLAQRYQSGRF